VSDPYLSMQRQIQELQDSLERLRKADAGAASGTAFPGSPPTNLVFYRSDLGLLCYYDGTRWLTVHEYYVPIILRQTFTLTNSLVEQVIRTDYAPYFTRSVTLTNVAAPNSGAAYWTFTSAGINTARSASTTIETWNTSGDTAAVETLRDNAPNTSATIANRTLIRGVVQITAGAPGAITIAHALYFRLIIT
jgi:hypothetical protein